MRTLIHIDGQLYSPTAGWPRAREAIVTACRSGGGFVTLIGGNGVAEVFVGGGSSIHTEFVADEPTGPPPEDGFPDFDLDSL